MRSIRKHLTKACPSLLNPTGAGQVLTILGRPLCPHLLRICFWLASLKCVFYIRKPIVFLALVLQARPQHLYKDRLNSALIS